MCGLSSSRCSAPMSCTPSSPIAARKPQKGNAPTRSRCLCRADFSCLPVSSAGRPAPFPETSCLRCTSCWVSRAGMCCSVSASHSRTACPATPSGISVTLAPSHAFSPRAPRCCCGSPPSASARNSSTARPPRPSSSPGPAAPSGACSLSGPPSASCTATSSITPSRRPSSSSLSPCCSARYTTPPAA